MIGVSDKEVDTELFILCRLYTFDGCLGTYGNIGWRLDITMGCTQNSGSCKRAGGLFLNFEGYWAGHYCTLSNSTSNINVELPGIGP